MNIIEKIQEKTRQEYISIVKLWSAQLSGSIQQKPLQFCAGALAIGFIFAVYAALFFPLLLIVLAVALVVYFIAPEKKIS